MKTERRHELHTNWLADRMSEAADSAKPYAKAVGGVLLALVVLLCTYWYLSHRAETQNAEAWNDTIGALGAGTSEERADKLAQVADKYPGQPAALWALLIKAHDDLYQGNNLLASQKSAGTSHLDDALTAYKSVEQKATDPLLRQSALFGIGRTHESLNELKEAVNAYKQLVSEYPKGPYADRANHQIEQLERDSTQQRYRWWQGAARTLPNEIGGGKGTGSDDRGSSLFNPPKSPTDSPDSKSPSDTILSPELLPKSEPKKPDTNPAQPKTSGSGKTKPSDAKSPDAKSNGAKSDSAPPAPKKSDSVPPVAPPHDKKTPPESN